MSPYLMTVWSKPKVPHSISGVSLAPHKHRVRASRCPLRQLIQSQALAASLCDPSTCSRGESQGSHGQLRDCKETVVVGDGADGDDGLALMDVGGAL